MLNVIKNHALEIFNQYNVPFPIQKEKKMPSHPIHANFRGR